MADTTLRVLLVGEDKSASKAIKGVGAAAKKTSAAGEVMKGVLGANIIERAATGIIEFGRHSVEAFSELEDATAAAGVVFGSSMGQIERASASAAQQFGVSKQAYIDGAITMGTFGKAAGLTGDELAGFSNKLVQTAADMASFRGTTPEEAIQAVGAALRGESEPIRKYGVLLDDASLRQEALRQGLISTTKNALTPQQKVLAAQALILKQTTDAQGDFERTADSTANTQKRLAAETENASAAFGESLAPSVVQVEQGLSKLLKSAQDADGALSPLMDTALGLSTIFNDLTDTSGGAGQAIAWLMKQATDTSPLGALQLGLNAWRDSESRAAGETDKLTGEVTDWSSALKLNTSATNTNTAAQEDHTNATEDGSRELLIYTGRLNRAGRALSTWGARTDFAAAIDAVTDSIKENGKTLNKHTEAGRANRDTLANLANTGLSVVKSLQDQGKSEKAVRAAMRDTRQELIQAIHKMGIGGKAARDMADDLLGIKHKAKEAKDKLADLKTIAKQLDGKKITISVSASMNKSADEIVLNTGKSGTHWSFSTRATGGPVSRGVPYKVGERGWEVFVPDQNGKIVNQQQLAAGGAGNMGGIVVNYYTDVRGVLTEGQAGRAIDQALAKHANSGNTVQFLKAAGVRA